MSLDSHPLQAMQVYALRCEYLKNPLGIDIVEPRFGWKLQSARQNVLQSAYQVIVYATEDLREAIWDSGKVASDNSTHVAYGGSALESRQRYYWRVRVWDEQDTPSEWSQIAFWEMGLLQPTDWQASWVEPQQDPTEPEPNIHFFQNLGTVSPQPDSDYSRLKPAQYLRKTFSSAGKVTKARIYATAHGVYHLQVNGVRVGDFELAPEATAYEQYLQYQTYDVTDMITAGTNVIGAILADGWYCGRLGLPGDSCQYGNKLALLFQLEIRYEDGSIQHIVSDETFKSTTGALIYSDLFIGERYDATQDLMDWHQSTYNDSAWQAVQKVEYGYANLRAQYGEPLRAVMEIAPCAILITPKGETVIDLGQNIAGRIRMQVQGDAGTQITLDHSEVLDIDGNFLHRIMGRNKDQRDVYILKGDGVEVYEPLFTMHGFRYVRVSGYPSKLRLEDFTGIVIASDLQDTGTFTCSDKRINRLQENIHWSQRGNLVSIPTDCPQRERAGFTGDAQVFTPTASFNMDVAAFFVRWLRNLQAEQHADGQVTTTVPYWKSYIDIANQIQGGVHTSAGWGDACVIVPWVLYQTYGDKRILEENYAMMLRWLAYVQQQAETGIPERLNGKLTDDARARQQYLWNTGFHFGDWLIPSLSGGDHSPLKAAEKTKEIAASCFYAYTTNLMAQIATVLDRTDDIERFTQLNIKIREAFSKEYIAANGTLFSHYQGMYVLALKMNMAAIEQRPLLTQHLVELIAENDYRLDTGFLSVPFLMDVLCDNGREDVAYRLLFQTECPSWLYEVEHGATTIWESWDAIMPDGTVKLTSFNHYAFGAIGDWLYRFVAGLDKNQPGYKHIIIEPHPHKNLSNVRATYQSIYGEIISEWEVLNDTMKINITIPPNTTATVRLPHAELSSLAQDYTASQADNSVVVQIGSGSYAFEYLYINK